MQQTTLKQTHYIFIIISQNYESIMEVRLDKSLEVIATMKKHRQFTMPLATIASLSTLTFFTVGAIHPATAIAAVKKAPSEHSATTHGKAKHNQQIKHVVYIIMDNVHYSDIKQMPHVMKFLQQGTILTNDHTVLDSHTQDGMLSDMTGKYPSQTGVIDQGYYENGQYAGFKYWTSNDPDGLHHVTTTPNWTTFNEHGTDVGAIGAPDMELESASEVDASMMSSTDQNKADYLGVAVHHANQTTTFGAPNLSYIYNAKSWTDESKTLGAYPGWSDNADLNWSLQATYEMQTHNIPVTFTYLHDAHEVNGKEALPGTYDSTLAQYDAAMNRFLQHMNAAGLNSSNTLFVITTDEGDHLMPNGELTTNLTGWLSNNSLNTQDPGNLNIYGDSGALVYLKDPSTLANTLASLPAVPGWNYIADQAELKALHMYVGAAPDRDPSFVLFSKPDVYYGTSGSTDLSHDTNYYWNHGTINPDILDIWAGMVGPGVKTHNTSNQWVDHADTMPTIYSLLGYSVKNQGFDGVPEVSVLATSEHDEELLHAEDVYKQLNAPVGQFGMGTLRMSTEAAINAKNQEGQSLNDEIIGLTKQRDAVATKLQSDILSAFSGKPVKQKQLQADVDKAQSILSEVSSYAYY